MTTARLCIKKAPGVFGLMDDVQTASETYGLTPGGGGGRQSDSVDNSLGLSLLLLIGFAGFFLAKNRK